MNAKLGILLWSVSLGVSAAATSPFSPPNISLVTFEVEASRRNNPGGNLFEFAASPRSNPGCDLPKTSCLNGWLGLKTFLQFTPAFTHRARLLYGNDWFKRCVDTNAPVEERARFSQATRQNEAQGQINQQATTYSARRLATANRPNVPARLIAIDDQWRCEFEIDSGRQRLNLNEIVFWGHQRDQVRSPIIALRNGSRVVAEVDGLDASAIQIHSKYWRATSLPRQLIAGILFHVDANAARRDHWTQKLSEPSSVDRIWLVDGDFYDAEIVSLSADSDKLILRDRQVDIEVDLSRVKAVVFGAPASGGQSTEASAWLSFMDGSVIAADSVVERQNGLTIRCGPYQLESVNRQDEGQGWHILCGLRPMSSDVTYLSDLKPADYRYVPFLHGDWQYQMDLSVVNTRIRAEDQLFEKGVGMHAKSSLVFLLDRDARRLDFDLALDPSCRGQGSVVCRVLTLDQSNQWTEAYTSPVIRGAQPPISASANLQNARAVALTVDFADGGDVLDRVNWIMPRLIH